MKVTLTPMFHGGEFSLTSGSHPSGHFLLDETRDLAAAVDETDVGFRFPL